MRKIFLRLYRDLRGSSAAEFALVLPLLIIFLLGIIDVGRLMWTWNRAEKAAQMGVRFAVVTNPIPGGLLSKNFVGVNGLTQGDIIPADAYVSNACEVKSGQLKCDDCPSTCSWDTTPNTDAFAKLVERMSAYMNQIKDVNVKVIYRPSGLGFAGDPNGPDASPIVTVELKGLTFTPSLMQVFGTQITLPKFQSSLTMESGQTYTGQVPN